MTEQKPKVDLLGPDDLQIVDEDGNPIPEDHVTLEDLQPPSR